MHRAHIVVEEIQIKSFWSGGKVDLKHLLTPVWVPVMLAAGFVIICPTIKATSDFFCWFFTTKND